MPQGAAHFLTFADRETRRKVHRAIVALRPPRLEAASANANFGRHLLETRYQELQQAWETHRISNLDYLLRLNTISGRSYNDLTQYPVLPWVLQDYTSAELDLTEAGGMFRDLSKPVGALEPGRADKFAERFATYQDPGMDSKPFHYGSHYSSAGIVLYYLIRMEPFTTGNIQLQGGRFDVPDRLFGGIGETWHSCLTSMADVKELVPEFFYCAEFLRNENALDLGATQSGVALGDVRLPPWASSAEDFIAKHRAAAWSKWPSWLGHSWPPRAPQTAFEGLRLPSALGRRGLAPQITAGSDGSSATPRPRRHSHCA